MFRSSKIFDSSEGQMVYGTRTICEVLRQIYDMLFLKYGKSEPKFMSMVVPLLEEAYIDGLKMTQKLVDYKVSMPDWELNSEDNEVSRIRALRIHLTKKLNDVSRLKLAVVCNNKDYKMSAESYSKTYRDMKISLINRFGDVVRISKSCSAKDLDADVIIFFDPHSTHHIKIDGIKNHKAVKYTYFNDPHQKSFYGIYPNNQRFRKLGNRERANRAIGRGVNYIITPSVWGYNKYIAPNLGSDAEKMMIWFPPVPRKPKLATLPLSDRESSIMLSGHLWNGSNGFQPYQFRRWVCDQNNVTYVKHYAEDKNAEIRENYITLISTFRGAIAACEYYPVTKYFEIPFARTVLFAQECEDFNLLGFKHGVNCVVINKQNYHKVIHHFKTNYKFYQSIADAGKKHVEDNWTAEKFADHIYSHAEGIINGNR